MFLDELHAGPVDDLGVLLNALQNLTAAGRVPLKMIAAGIPSINGNLTRAATFGERTRWVTVPVLDLRSAAEALIWLAEVGGAEMDAEAARQLAGRAEEFPYLLQLFGDHAWRQWSARGCAGEITLDDAREGIQAAEVDTRATYQARCDAATPGEQECILATAEVMRDAREPAARRAALMVSPSVRTASM